MLHTIPWVLNSHWLTMMVYLHHTHPSIPHYRAPEGKKATGLALLGALSTIDRPFLGWQGRWFLHDISHFHVVHHLFPKMPWYHTETATTYLRSVIKDYNEEKEGEGWYRYAGEGAFVALWECYKACQFVEDEGTVVYYKDSHGKAVKKDIK